MRGIESFVWCVCVQEQVWVCVYVYDRESACVCARLCVCAFVCEFLLDVGKLCLDERKSLWGKRYAMYRRKASVWMCVCVCVCVCVCERERERQRERERKRSGWGRVFVVLNPINFYQPTFKASWRGFLILSFFPKALRCHSSTFDETDWAVRFSKQILTNPP